jgi:acetyl-CoA/propionyl-CoA carboxylase biotin carboxyl carrier protein
MMAKNVILLTTDGEFRASADAGIITVDGVETTIPPRVRVAADGDRRWVFLNGDVFEFQLANSGQSPTTRKRGGAHHGSLTAPMPATVVRINTEQGATVRRGETLLVLEAMKMELPVRADADGTVSAIKCRVGELVQPGVPLIELA